MNFNINNKFTINDLVVPIGIVLSFWIVFWVELRFHYNFTTYGILPHNISGLKGIITAPFIHSSLKHLFNNSIPTLVLTTALFYFYKRLRWKVLFFGFLFTGIFTWLLGREAFHIGASGIVYMLVSFLFFKGIFTRKFPLVALSLSVVFIYGGLIWYLFPIDPKISWEGHLSGFIVGFFLALVLKEKDIKVNLYEWQKPDYKPEEDPFLQQFDENGNFFEKPKQVEETNDGVEVTYHFIEKE